MSGVESLRVRVIDVVRETPDAHSFVLEPTEPMEISYKPGQFLTVRVPSEMTGAAVRSYSLSSSPTRDEPLKITVKRTAEGYVSNWMCDNVVPGTELDLLPPAGVFSPASLDADLLLVAGGSGVTPVLSILKASLDEGRGHVTLIYANRDEGSVIFAGELRAIQKEYADRVSVIHWLESVQGVPSIASLRELIRPYAGREAFVCGPGPFMDATVEALETLGAGPDRVHTEKFVSLTSNPFAMDAAAADPEEPSGQVEVTLDGETRRLSWPRSKRLVDVLLDAGMDAPYSCREGACRACACVLLDGEVTMVRNDVLDAADLADGLVLGCQALPVSDSVRVSYDD